MTQFRNARERRIAERELAAKRQAEAPREEVGWGLDGQEVRVQEPAIGPDERTLLAYWHKVLTAALEQMIFGSSITLWIDEVVYIRMDWDKEIQWSKPADPSTWTETTPEFVPLPREPAALPLIREWKGEASSHALDALALTFTQPEYTKLAPRAKTWRPK